MTSGRAGSMFFAVTVGIILMCILFILEISGVSHEAKKFKSIWALLFLVLFFQFVIGDPIKIAAYAIDAAIWPKQQRKFTPDWSATHHNRMDYLKLRLKSLRSQLVITEGHRNEKLNLKFKHIANEMFVYASYFLILLCMILVTRDELLYYNTAAIRQLFLVNQSTSLGLNNILHLGHIYIYIETALIKPFDTHSTPTGVTGWDYADQNRMLGVVRLRQLRIITSHIGFNQPVFSGLSYMTAWKLPYERLPYTNKYWRIFEPWLPLSQHLSFSESLLLNFFHDGGFLQYPELKGYVALLTRSKNNSMRVLNYLKNHNWLNYDTSAIFMDFTLYNVDANLFTTCTLWAERTPFGSIMPHAYIESVRMMGSIANLPMYGTIVLLLYFFVVIQLSKKLFLRLWYEPKQLKKMWVKVDLLIFILNFLVILIIVLRESLVDSMLKRVETASKLEFIDFRQPTRLNLLCNLTAGILICIATLRLWKVMQFASIFQLFTNTLYLAWQAMFHTAGVIAIFVMAFGIAVVVINGNYSSGFNRLIKSIVSCMCYSFGFSSQVNPNDLFHGGRVLGVILYGILAFVLAVLLINVFVSMLNDFFTKAKAERDEIFDINSINFIQFLKVEYASILNYFASVLCMKRSYNRRHRTVAQNIKRTLDSIDKKHTNKVNRAFHTAESHSGHKDKIEEAKLHLKYRLRIERLFTLAAIIQTQMEIMERHFFNDRDGEEPESEEGEVY